MTCFFSKKYFLAEKFEPNNFCRVTKNESNEIIIFWIDSIISKSVAQSNMKNLKWAFLMVLRLVLSSF